MPSMSTLLSIILALTTTAWALPHSILRAQNSETIAAAPPRLVAYIQTFKTVDGGPLSLLPLLEEKTGVTHVLLSAVHLNEQPGDITLNEHHPNDTMYDTLWSEVKQLQDGGIKVMMMLGGAAPGTYQRLSGDDQSVSLMARLNITVCKTNKLPVPRILRPLPRHTPPIQHPRSRHRYRGIRPHRDATSPASLPERRPRDRLHLDHGARRFCSPPQRCRPARLPTTRHGRPSHGTCPTERKTGQLVQRPILQRLGRCKQHRHVRAGS